MKSTTWTLVLAAAVLATGSLVESAQEKTTLEGRVIELEQALAAQAKTQAMQTTELERLRSDLDQAAHYLRSQAKASTAMLRTLDEAEKLGFTKGINFSSREALLTGWRARLEAAQKDLPGKLEEEQSTRPGKRAETGTR